MPQPLDYLAPDVKNLDEFAKKLDTHAIKLDAGHLHQRISERHYL